MLDNRRILGTLLLAIVLLLVAVGIEHPYFHTDEEGWKSAVFQMSALVSLLKEISFALLIASAISFGIERQSRDHDIKIADRLRKDIAEDVFKGVFSRNLPRKYVDAVIQGHLRPNLIRGHLSVSIAIEECSDKIAKIIGTDDYVVFIQRSTYSIKNISSSTVTEVLTPYCPVVREEFLSVVGMTKFFVNVGGQGKRDVLPEFLVTLNKESAQYRWQLTLKSGESAEIMSEMVSVKDRADTAIWGTMYPTMSTDMDVLVTARDIVPLITARTLTELTEVFVSDDGRTSRWRIDGPMVVNNSITVSW